MRVLLTDYAWPDLAIEHEIISQAGHELVVSPDGSEATLARLARDVSAIVTCWAEVRAGVIDACADCRIVSRLGIGLDNIDVDHCTSKGIPVTNVPAYCVDEVAEHALALLLALARNVAFFHHRTKQGEYSLEAGGPMYRLAGRTLGVIGFGRIGKAVAERALGLGLNVLVHNKSGYEGPLQVTPVDLETLLAKSELISLHVPLKQETRHLINRQTLDLMQPGTLLVNTSRGGVIDPQALMDAVSTGKLGGVGLDVHDPEPPDLSDPMYRHERVIATPHAAFTSQESLAELRRTGFQQVVQALAGSRPDNVVNPQIWDEA